ncbi:hypothetical protein GUJ93_ZPchr0006g42220 [Zizania palustris]|uniref:peroxidase n=1 Tax=Zizania palustris TaxID=103762 RepID=A0A8J5SXS3_ZIZPA|nr:hypothetical protein GUJ93_ZPchr0006g42220 [Zizania palustris]KAG8073492.1 hypothetical protein GUJ93_ZPchr0006g42220 [Zizania palustris]
METSSLHLETSPWMARGAHRKAIRVLLYYYTKPSTIHCTLAARLGPPLPLRARCISTGLSPLARSTIVMDARILLLVAVAVAAAAAPLASAQLETGFYRTTCPDAEKVVFNVIEKRFKADPATSALLLRMIFHDCFANGCDASLLIDPLSNQSAEKEAGPNMSVRGYDIIDEIKTELEKICPNVVSCADIVVLSARDGVRLAGGPAYKVPTGRRDSLVSNRDDADNLPGPDIAVPKLIAEFADKGFSTEEMIALVAGGHTIGTVKCFFIEVDAAPIDPVYRANVTKFCDGKDGDRGQVSLDEITPNIVDANYFSLALAKRMPLTVDRLMGLDPTTKPIVQSMADKPADFTPLFAKAMEKLSAMKVITGKDGEIRKSCSEFNNPVKNDDSPSVIRISSLLPGEMEGLSPAVASKEVVGDGKEPSILTNSVPADMELNKVAVNQAAPAKEATSDAKAAGGLDAAGNEAATKKVHKKKKKNKKASKPSTETARKSTGKQSFSMAGAAGAGNEGTTGGEEIKKEKRSRKAKVSEAAGNEAASKKAAGAGAEAGNVGRSEEAASKVPGGEEAKARHQPKLRGGQQL